jgi:hypothetical protein
MAMKRAKHNCGTTMMSQFTCIFAAAFVVKQQAGQHTPHTLMELQQ